MVTEAQIRSQLNNCLLDAKFDRWADSYKKGKVRDMYLLDGKRILVATDRQSAFDHVLGAIPLKGQVLNRMAHYWFQQTEDIMPNHIIALPDPNVTVGRELTILPVEIVVRQYLTGSTDTSIWTNYAKGVRNFCGIDLPDGMVKNQKLETAIITPTTKADDHDELISAAEIIEQGLVDADRWAEVEEKALALFARGTELAAQRGLILVDTKYEMGIDSDGKLTLADEIHTPDSSRYWVLDSYEARHKRGEEPENLDKEFLRLWLREKGISDTNIPKLDDDIRTQVSQRYIDSYERMTGESFDPEIGDIPVAKRIEKNIEQYF